MKIHAKCAALKANARQALIGHYLTLCGAFVTLFFLQYIITIPESLMQAKPPVGIIFYYLFLFLLKLFFTIFSVGLAGLFLGNACGQPIAQSGLFSGFWHGPAKIMQMSLLPSAIEFIPDCLLSISLIRYLETREQLWMNLMLAASFFSVVLYLLTAVLYSQIYFITLDFPEMSPLECLRYSRHLLKGHRLEFIYLNLSFIPLILLGVLSCGIGLLYVNPYINQTYAFYYLDLVRSKK